MGHAATVRPSSAFLTVDPDRPGRQAGFVMIPHSPHDDAWGVTRVPVAVIANGTGPTVILEGGNHGDEYEGPIVIGELIRDLDPGRVQGRLILMPANNIHAVNAARRTSPVDGLNFNRVFPGDPWGTISQQIAAFLVDRVFPLGDAFMDLHSGGSSLDILPSAIVEPAADPSHFARNAAAARAFDAPCTVVIGNLGDPRTATAAAVRAGMTTMGTEMGGGGRVSLEALAICRRGVRRALAHFGVLEPEPDDAPRAPGPLLELAGPPAYVYAADEGAFEPLHPLGARVAAGEPVGRVHCLSDPARAPQILVAGTDGLVYGRRHPGLVRPGNCCLVVASPWRGA